MKNRAIKCWNCGFWSNINDTINHKCDNCNEYLEKDKIAYLSKKRLQNVNISKKNKTILSVKKTDPYWLKRVKIVLIKINLTFFAIFLILTFLILLTHS